MRSFSICGFEDDGNRWSTCATTEVALPYDFGWVGLNQLFSVTTKSSMRVLQWVNWSWFLALRNRRWVVIVVWWLWLMSAKNFSCHDTTEKVKKWMMNEKFIVVRRTYHSWLKRSRELLQSFGRCHRMTVRAWPCRHEQEQDDKINQNTIYRFRQACFVTFVLFFRSHIFENKINKTHSQEENHPSQIALSIRNYVIQ